MKQQHSISPYAFIKSFVVLLSITFILSIDLARAQTPTFKEWFRQKKLTREYMAKQIALLQIQLEYVKKGYKVVSAGLTTLENIRNGDFNLHRDFFSSLKNVKPAIANSAKVIDIIAFQSALIKESSRVRSFCRNNPNLSATEIRYVTAIYTNLVKLTDSNASELLTLIRSGESQMTDDERIKRIDKVHREANDQLVFARSFASELRVLSVERSREHDGIQSYSKLALI
jgi:hypothetical protein